MLRTNIDAVCHLDKIGITYYAFTIVYSYSRIVEANSYSVVNNGILCEAQSFFHWNSNIVKTIIFDSIHWNLKELLVSKNSAFESALYEI